MIDIYIAQNIKQVFRQLLVHVYENDAALLLCAVLLYD